MPIEDCSEEKAKSCGTDTAHPEIVLPHENKMIARFSNEGRELHTYYEVDGCLVENERAADYVVIKDGVGAVVVELKGRDVRSGARQITETARQMRRFQAQRHGGRIAGLLVSVRVPQGARTDLQRAQEAFRREFGRDLSTSNGNGKKRHRVADLVEGRRAAR